jgi:phytoene dehydrogenase-like protein
VLGALGIEPSGRTVDGPGAYVYVLRAGRLEPLPRNGYSVLTSRLLGAAGKLAFARLLLTLDQRKAERVRGKSVREWLASETRDAGARALLEMFVRLTSYTHAPDLLPADMAVRQLALAVTHGVMYVDGGFQSLVDAVHARALEAGVQIELGVGVDRIEYAQGSVHAVLTADGRRWPALAVIAAVEPSALARMLPGEARAQRWADASVPLRAACLDLGVRALPHPERVNVQALDAPLYFANHSVYARLAPEGANTLHLVRYLAPGEDGRDKEPELHAFLEQVQPGVYARAEVKRFMPNLVVYNDVPSSERARALHPEIEGLYLVGDFASERALLTDAVLDSAQQAADRCEARVAAVRAVAPRAAEAQQCNYAGPSSIGGAT